MIIKTFSDGSYLEYAKGSFDQWCVFMVNPTKRFRQPPRDIQYFGFLKFQARRFGCKKIYDDFVAIYDMTHKDVERCVLEKIDTIAATYDDAALAFSKIYTILYMGMIAEEKKERTRLGKRIKRLGIHKLLIEEWFAEEAANFMRKMNWRTIDLMCKELGF